MEEKIGIEKLIPLLNERHNLEWVLGSNVNGDYLFVKGDKDNKFYEEQIISKKFGFIKWLVDNDKIDYKKIHGNEWYFKLVDTCDYDGEERCNILLMLLAISDTPIEDLISYLK